MKLAEALMEIGAIQINTAEFFTWTSGIESPIYCDNRLTISYPSVRKEICRQFAARIKELPGEVDVIAGCATAGIPHAAWLSEELGLPMVYVRGSKKKHGKENLIEGEITAGQRVVVIEDLISTGGSAVQAAAALKDTGAHVKEVLSIFTYELPQSADVFREADLSYSSLLTYSELIDTLNLNEENKRVLENWRSSMKEKKGK
ncbi:orotate phosphoribosyltransferase [Salimicrobium jeotgali]|uniref:Orotate phosphoribosyltransferase n=1 Tax=Salimicrobium jeotgali TaxID=1230341 RepID=K2GN87_9BACI|nr:orotate phosphoribosyltransferase [Salimicrobium jeotgali]EKE31874.1 orotate phosphoribosyltransferase [Salimicrobium jeotgali]MBM7696163.1 orotate phosphoribosyltransferase [Salimicrobium jeotgali]